MPSRQIRQDQQSKWRSEPLVTGFLRRNSFFFGFSRGFTSVQHFFFGSATICAISQPDPLGGQALRAAQKSPRISKLGFNFSIPQCLLC